jgi:capsule biosynthesis phosphatase
MIKKEKIIVMDIDGTITEGLSIEKDYSSAIVSQKVKKKLIQLHEKGYWIILHTSRNMRTYEGNIGRILKNTAPILLKWLDDNDIPFDEIYFGKPWCGNDGFYVDDKAIRPREFAELTLDQINDVLKKDAWSNE